MAISLGGIELPSTVIWRDREIGNPVLQQRDITLGRRQIITYAALPTGRTITLTGILTTGWIKYSVFLSLKALGDAVGITYVFDYEGNTYDVVFKHDDPPAIEGDPLVYRNNQQPDDYYTYTIKLVTV